MYIFFIGVKLYDLLIYFNYFRTNKLGLITGDYSRFESLYHIPNCYYFGLINVLL